MVKETTYDNRLEVAVEGTEKPQEQVEGNFLTLSSGVVLEKVPFSRAILYEILKAFKPPKVPVYFNPAKEREEENPLDPDYLKAVENQEIEVAMALIDLGIIKGTKLFSIPSDFASPESADWVEEIAYFGTEVPTNKKLRYLKWVKLVAVKEDEDLAKLTDFVLPNFGVTEKSVEDAMNKFPGDEERGADLQSQAS